LFSETVASRPMGHIHASVIPSLPAQAERSVTRNLSCSRTFVQARSRPWPTRSSCFAMFALASTLLTCSLSARAQSASIPALSFNDLSGKPHTLADYRGKIMVLNFWATWCLPCREETPMLSKLATNYADKDVAFL